MPFRYNARLQPLSQPRRYPPLDILRGLALSGVLLVNLLTVFRVSLFSHITGADTPSDAWGYIVSTIVSLLLEFKAFTLFSFVFGAGVAIQVERASGRSDVPASFLVRRFLVLLVFGLTHLLLIWNGDILTLYAVCGLLLIPLLRLPTTLIALMGAVLIALSYLGVIPIAFPGTQSLQTQAAEATRVYAEGSFAEIFFFRWRETNHFILPLLLLTLPRTLGVILLGVAAWRSNLLTTRRNLWVPILLVSGTIGITGTVLHIDWAAHVPLAFAYVAAVLLWLPKAPLLAAGGQMALTNYLTQSVVFSLVFYGYGFGYFGRLGVASTAAAGLTLYVAQMLFSRWWLFHFQFGPAEWLWRSLTYGRRQPFLRGSQLTLSPAGARVMSVFIILFMVPLIHGGIPWILGGRGPHWGWTPAHSPGIVNYLGPLLAGGAMALLVWILATTLSQVHLMRERWAIGLRPARLVQTGPYAWTRHPLYVAELLLWLGGGCYLGSPAVMAVGIAGAVLVVTIVVPREERALESYFGDEYREYRKRVPF